MTGNRGRGSRFQIWVAVPVSGLVAGAGLAALTFQGLDRARDDRGADVPSAVDATDDDGDEEDPVAAALRVRANDGSARPCCSRLPPSPRPSRSSRPRSWSPPCCRARCGPAVISSTSPGRCPHPRPLRSSSRPRRAPPAPPPPPPVITPPPVGDAAGRARGARPRGASRGAAARRGARVRDGGATGRGADRPTGRSAVGARRRGRRPSNDDRGDDRHRLRAGAPGPLVETVG